MTKAKAAHAPAPDLTLHTPGDEGALTATELQAHATEGDDAAAQLAALQAENASLKAMVEAMQDKLDAAGDQAEAPPPPAPRLIGEDWRHKTTAEAHAAGVTKTVLCSDGYYVPGA